MNSTPIIDMFSDSYGPAREYLKARFRNVEISSDFRDQDVPEGSIVAIGAPYQDLSVAGKRAGAERGSGTRLNAAFVEWLMGLPSAHAVGLSRAASIRLAGNAVVRLQARLMLQRGLTTINHERGL